MQSFQFSVEHNVQEGLIQNVYESFGATVELNV